MGLARLLDPRSIAVVGASPTSRTGRFLISNLVLAGYQGQIFPVNPNYSKIFGLRCVPSLSEISETVDAVVVAVGSTHVEPVIREAASLGVGAAVVIANGFAETGKPEDCKVQRRLRETVEGSGMLLIGPNCLGTISFGSGAALYMERLPEKPLQGGTAVVCQSGVTAAAILHSGQVPIAHLVTVGNEAATTLSEIAIGLVDRPDVDLLVLHLESRQRLESLKALAAKARARQIPVVVLHGGRTHQARGATISHTGLEPMEHQAFCQIASDSGFVVADDTAELVALAGLFATRIKAKPVEAGLGVATVSGGQVALFIDYAAETGLELATFNKVSGSRLKATLGENLHVLNPIDTARSAFSLSAWDETLSIISTDENTGIVGIGGPGDAAGEFAWNIALGGVRIVDQGHRAVVYFRSRPDEELDTYLRGRGVLVVDSTKQGFAALRKYIDFWANA